MGGRGEDADRRHPFPAVCGLASNADGFGLSFPFQLHRPLEHRDGRGLGLAVAALRLDRLCQQLGPREQRLLRLLRILVGPYLLALWPMAGTSSTVGPTPNRSE